MSAVFILPCRVPAFKAAISASCRQHNTDTGYVTRPGEALRTVAIPPAVVPEPRHQGGMRDQP